MLLDLLIYKDVHVCMWHVGFFAIVFLLRIVGTVKMDYLPSGVYSYGRSFGWSMHCHWTAITENEWNRHVPMQRMVVVGVVWLIVLGYSLPLLIGMMCVSLVAMLSFSLLEFWKKYQWQVHNAIILGAIRELSMT